MLFDQCLQSRILEQGSHHSETLVELEKLKIHCKKDIKNFLMITLKILLGISVPGSVAKKSFNQRNAAILQGISLGDQRASIF